MTGRGRLSLGVLREAVRKRVGETSLRETADEIGVSFSGLGSFVRGETSPHPKTRGLLVRWYYGRASTASAPPREDIDIAIEVLRTYVADQSKPRSVQERRLREIIEQLEERS